MTAHREGHTWHDGKAQTSSTCRGNPITRIVGSLGIYTKIDFKGQGGSPSATAPRRSSAATASFMKGKDPRATRTSSPAASAASAVTTTRTCSVYNQNMGLRGTAAAPRRVDHQPRRGRGVHVRPQTSSRRTWVGGRLSASGWSARPTLACLSAPNSTEAHRHRGPSTATGPSATHSCARLKPARGRVLPRGAPGVPGPTARDVSA